GEGAGDHWAAHQPAVGGRAAPTQLGAARLGQLLRAQRARSIRPGGGEARGVIERARKLAAASGCKSRPGSCQEAREQAAGVGGKRPASKRSVKSPSGGSNRAVRSIKRSLPRRQPNPKGTQEEPSPEKQGE